MSIAQKLTTIAQNQQKVFEAGKEFVVNELKEAQKGTASGEVISITDISPIEHTMAVKVSNANAVLSACGKNLFNNDTSLIKQLLYYGATSGTEFKRYGYEITLPVGTYTIHTISKVPSSDTHLYYIYGNVVDENNIVKGTGVNTVVNSQLQTKTFTIQSGQKLLIYDGETAGLSEAKKAFSRFDFQLEVGESVTKYEPYVESVTYTPNTDGTVEGVKSIYPTTLLSANIEGTLIECEYIKDLNAVVGELTDSILSIGGMLNV